MADNLQDAKYAINGKYKSEKHREMVRDFIDKDTIAGCRLNDAFACQAQCVKFLRLLGGGSRMISYTAITIAAIGTGLIGAGAYIYKDIKRMRKHYQIGREFDEASKGLKKVLNESLEIEVNKK
jgi:hypothetical protein